MIKSILNKNPNLLKITSIIYNTFFFNNSWRYRRTNKFLFSGAFLKANNFYILGKNNTITIGYKARLRNCKFTVIGDNCKIFIGGGSTIISNTHFWCQDNGSTISIGCDFTMEGGHIAATEEKSITVGNDCMFSGDIEIRNGDSHSILDAFTRTRINQAQSVSIGDHVWLAAHVRILKGSTIPSNSIVGNSSVVTSKFENVNALYSGIPCRMIKDNIDWDRNKI